MASGRMEFHADTIMQHTGFSFVLPLFLVSKQESEKAVDDVVAH